MKLEHVFGGLMAFIRAERWSELERTIVEHKGALFDARAEEVFDDIAWANADNPEATEVIELRRQHLAILRRHGLGALYAQLQGYGQSFTVDPKLIDELTRSQSPEAQEDLFDRHPEMMLLVRHITKQDIYPARQPNVGRGPIWNEWEAAQQATPERRVEFAKRALEECDRDLFPALWAELHVGLGNDWAARTSGDAAENEAASQRHYAIAQQVLTPEDYPIEWAHMQVDIGNGLVRRGAAADKAMLEQAMAHYQAALEYLHQDRPSALTRAVLGLKPELLAIERAQLCVRLAELYSLHPGDVEIFSEQAMPHLMEAQEVFVAQHDAAGEASIRLLLGQMALARYSEDPDVGRDTARQAFEKVLELVSPETEARLWAIAKLKLGDLMRVDIDVTRPSERLRAAQEHLSEAFAVLDRHGLDIEWTALAACGLAQIECEQVRDGGAFGPAFARLGALLESVPSAKRHVAGGIRLSIARLHLAYAGVCDSASPDEAENQLLQALQDYDRTQFPTTLLTILEELGRMRFRARRWADALDALTQAAALNDELLFAAERAGTIQSLVARSPDIFPRTAYCLLKLKRPFEALLALEQGKNRVFKRAHLDPGHTDALTFEALAAAVPRRGAFAFLMATELGSFAVVVPASAKTIADENVIEWRATDTDLAALAAGDDKSPGWINAWVKWKQGGSHEAWQDAIQRNCEAVWEALMQSVHERLVSLGVANGSQVVLFLHGWLVHFPLHAACGMREGRPVCFGEEFVASYAPSLAVYLREAPAVAGKPRLLSVVDPSGDLPFAALEAGLVARHFPAKAVTSLVETRATPEAFRDRVTGSTHVHLLCHGYFHMRDALSSGVMLAGGRTLTVREISSATEDLSAVRLLTMAGCETALSQIARRYGRNVYTTAASEFTGLVMAWIVAGVQTVISAMWPVDDFPTALLMGEFYRRYRSEEENPAWALFCAQHWLRELDREALLEFIERELAALENDGTASGARLRSGLADVRSLLQEDYRAGDHPFDHPYYWAAFVATGSRVR